MSANQPTGAKKKSVPKKVDGKALEVVHPNAAGIDVGGSEHGVAVSPDRDPEPVRCFGCFTADLREMAGWLVEKGVRSVAMQSTGVYGMPVFEILEQQGLEVYLVNAQHTKNVPGRKSDMQECPWLLKLHAILDGARDPWELAAWVEPGVKATPEDIVKSLEGNWREEWLFVLRQHVEFYQIYQNKIRACDLPLRKHLQSLGSKLDLPAHPLGPRLQGKQASRNAPAFDLRTELYRITGIDWSQINGIDVLTAQTVIAEAGADLSAFPSEKQFTSWLGLCPTHQPSGKKILNRRTRKVVNRATVAFRNAAMTLVRSQSYLGAQYRRLRTRLGAPKAITAMARKLGLPVLPAHQARPTVRGTKAPNTTRPDIANSRSERWQNERKSLAFN